MGDKSSLRVQPHPLILLIRTLPRTAHWQPRPRQPPLPGRNMVLFRHNRGGSPPAHTLRRLMPNRFLRLRQLLISKEGTVHHTTFPHDLQFRITYFRSSTRNRDSRQQHQPSHLGPAQLGSLCRPPKLPSLSHRITIHTQLGAELSGSPPQPPPLRTQESVI